MNVLGAMWIVASCGDPPLSGLSRDHCRSRNLQPTTISGTVFAPNGTLPLSGVSVYVPNSDPGPFQPGVQCGACAQGLGLLGNPIVDTITDEAGKFTLTDVPNGPNIPVVIAIGKWRRQLKIANVAECSTVTLDKADTALPRSHDDMTANTISLDMPQIALSTGRADSLECLVRRLGIADKEITTDKESGKVHLFADLGATTGGAGVGTASFAASFAGGSRAFSDSQTLWGTATDPGKLNNYDMVILSCEGAQHVETKPQQAMDHLKEYADLGGRVFLSHWHNIWIEGSTTGANANGARPDIWLKLAQWSNSTDNSGPSTDALDERNDPRGASFATWMQNVGGSPPDMRGLVPIQNLTGRSTCTSIDFNNVEQWVYWQKDATTQLTQNFLFSTPNEKPRGQRCGKVAFSDMHVSGGPLTDANNIVLPYPESCGTETDLSPQEQALAFMFFDISSCIIDGG
jgi:hypothetical protein